MTTPEMVPVAEVAKRWGCRPTTVRQMCKERTLPYMWYAGGSFFILRTPFEKHMAGEEIHRLDVAPIAFVRRIERSVA